MCKVIKLKTFNNRGVELTPVELKDVVPFEVKRIYYMSFGSKDCFTGQHCHKVEQEFFVQMKGNSTIIIDKGNGKEELKLDGPNTAIYVPAYVWHGFKDPEGDCQILALSSTNYSADRSDYIEDYSEYLKVRDQNLKV
jgi:oxalate decarboxylase/phosphoglucose isomerase-like protein (cupin superfamily)